MTDKELAALFMAQLLPRMQEIPELYGVALVRNFQPRQQGASKTSAAYFVKLGDRRHGSPKRRDVWNETAEQFEHEEIQQYETTYQFSAMVPQDPADVVALTESDILNLISGIMQSDTLLEIFRAAGVGVQRVTEVRNPYVVLDRDRFEALPTFDVVLTHNRIRRDTLPAVVAYDANISRV